VLKCVKMGIIGEAALESYYVDTSYSRIRFDCNQWFEVSGSVCFLQGCLVGMFMTHSALVVTFLLGNRRVITLVTRTRH
jgi:hypothetical protein